MITLKYNNSEGKLVTFYIHAKIIVGYNITDTDIEIFFSSTPELVKARKGITYQWSFKTTIRQLINPTEVFAFLNTIKKPVVVPITKPSIQSKMKF
jgi:hypothetical protein